jgi:hypothetical protein
VGSYDVSVEGLMAGQVIINSLGFRITASTGFETPGEALELATNVRNAWQTNILPELSNQYLFVGVTARGLTEPGIAETSPATVGAGSKTSAPLPTFVAVKYKFRTATPGRAGRGRTGLAGFPELGTPETTPNRIAPNSQEQFLTVWQAFRAAIAAASQPAEQVVISRVLGGVPRAIPLVSLVTSVQVDAELGTRVSRLR